MFHEDNLYISYDKYNKTIFWLVIHIAKNLFLTILKAIFSIFIFFAPSDSRYLNSNISNIDDI